jgi:hypothetical protein
VVGFSKDNSYKISLQYSNGNEKDINRIFEKFLSTFDEYKLIKQFTHNCKILDNVIEDIKNDYLKDGYDYMVEELENGEFEMIVSIHSLENLNDVGFKKQFLQFTKDVIDVVNGRKSVDDVSFIFDIKVEVEVTVDFHSPKYFVPITVFKDVSKDEKLHFVLNDIIVEKDKHSPYKLITLVFSTELM